MAAIASAVPAAPNIDRYASNNLQFSKIELARDTTSGYKSMVKYNGQANIVIKFNQWNGMMESSLTDPMTGEN
ncbi:chitinase N-terminal domain-containing protein [Psychromonas hadalis]|uniref:chitinase N-terminal domain-containing protein n=1 Tax=Psychromonas hadalis TaxID=211669 RepID=UPI0003B3F485|nr:chitinase N-terminal domain-containing protein [Psychromonas hadalis]